MRTLIALSAFVSALALVVAAAPALAQMGGMGMSSSSSGPDPQAAYAAGVTAYNGHDYAEAIRQLRAVRDRNAPPGAYLQLGLVSLELGDRSAASAQQAALQTQLSRCDAACGDARRALWQAAYDQLTQALGRAE